MTRRPLLLTLLIPAALAAAGCSSDERLARFAEQAAERQAEQNRRMADLQHEVAEGTRRLVEADAEAREAFAGLHRDLQAERGEVGRQRDALEEERREIASQRVTDPLVAAAVMNAAALLACVLPLLVCWRLLRRDEAADGGDALVAEALLEDLVSDRPVLLAPPPERRLLADGRDRPRDEDRASLPPA